MRFGRILGLTLALGVVGAPNARADDYYPQWPRALQSDVLRIARGFPGEFALYVKDLSTGTRYTFNAATPMYLASGVKIPVMVALFRQIKARRASLAEELIYEESDQRDGSPVMNYAKFGTAMTVEGLLNAMIHNSDNAATDMVIRHIGIEEVNRGLVLEGIFGFGPITTLIDVRRAVYKNMSPKTLDFEPKQIFELAMAKPLSARLTKLAEFTGEPPGTFTPADYQRAYRRYYQSGYNSAPVEAMADLLERLVRGKVVSKSYSDQMMDVLHGTKTGTRRVRAGLPEGVLLAHKTGTQYRRVCDFGVFYMQDGRPIVFAVAVQGGKGPQAFGRSRGAARATHLLAPLS